MSGRFGNAPDWGGYTEAFEIVAGWNGELLGSETEAELFRRVLDIALEDLQLSTVTIYRFDEEAATLRPAATSMAAADPVSPGDNPVWEAFRNETPTVFERDRSETDGESEYQFAVPLGEDCVLVAGGGERLDDGEIVEIVRTLCLVAESVLTGTQYERQLRECDRELTRRRREIERIEKITETYRDVAQAAVLADTSEDLNRGICDRLVENDVVEFAWIGELDRTSEEITPREWAGSERGFLEHAPIDLDAPDEPTARAARSNDVTVIENLASGSGDDHRRSEALERGFRSVMAIPLSHDGILHGVVTIYADRSDAFEGATEPANEIGSLVGHAITAIRCQNGLLSHTSTELDVEITAPACFFARFVRETETSVSFEAMSPAEDGSVVVFVRAEDPGLLVQYAEKAVAVGSVERFECDADEDIVKGRFDDSFIGSFLSTYGITLESASATPEEVRITVSIPPGMTARQALDIVNSEYPNSVLLAKRERQRAAEGPIASRNSLLDQLTDRQREVVEHAYREGYFETPKQVTGESLAASMDISASAFHNHLRSAEAELFSWLFGNETE
jgi:predicted DNA binding protein/GAF domain-containing protein